MTEEQLFLKFSYTFGEIICAVGDHYRPAQLKKENVKGYFLNGYDYYFENGMFIGVVNRNKINTFDFGEDIHVIEMIRTPDSNNVGVQLILDEELKGKSAFLKFGVYPTSKGEFRYTDGQTIKIIGLSLDQTKLEVELNSDLLLVYPFNLLITSKD